MNFNAYKATHEAANNLRKEEIENTEFIKLGKRNFTVVEKIPSVSVENYGEHNCSMIFLNQNGYDGLWIYNPETSKLSDEKFESVQRLMTNLFVVKLKSNNSRAVYVDDTIIDEESYKSVGLGKELEELIKKSVYDEHVAREKVKNPSEGAQSQPQ